MDQEYSIATKLSVSFLTVALLSGMVGWVGRCGVRRLDEGAGSMYADRFIPMRDIGNAHAALGALHTAVQGMLLEPTVAAGKKLDQTSPEHIAAVEVHTATTNEIARNISGVATAADSTTGGATDVQRAARSLSEMAAQPQTITGAFR